MTTLSADMVVPWVAAQSNVGVVIMYLRGEGRLKWQREINTAFTMYMASHPGYQQQFVLTNNRYHRSRTQALIRMEKQILADWSIAQKLREVFVFIIVFIIRTLIKYH